MRFRVPPFSGSSASSSSLEGPSAPAVRWRLGLAPTFALQFAAICVLGSLVGNVTWGLKTGGPAFVWAWILGGLLQLSVALSIAELSSTFPLTGACYSWLRHLGYTSVAWFTGYLLLSGYVAALADNDTGLASSLLSFADVGSPTGRKIAIVALACLVSQLVLTLLSLKIALYGVVLSTAVQLLALGGVVLGLTIVGLRHGPALLFNATGTTTHEHLPAFLLMLMIPAWTITAFDAAGNFAGEMSRPTFTAPRGLMAAALVSFLGGTVLIIVALLALPNLGQTSRIQSALLFIVHTRIGVGAATLFNALVITCLFFLPVVLLLVAARLLWAQARDGAWPMAKWLTMLSRQGIPARATILCAALAGLLCLMWPALYGLGTVWPALWPLAYAITITAGLTAKLKGRLPPERAWNLGRWGMANDLLAILWSLFLAGLLPLFDATHAVPLFVLIVLAGTLSYVLWIKPRWLPGLEMTPSMQEPDPAR
jgi:amino acid transporter